MGSNTEQSLYYGADLHEEKPQLDSFLLAFGDFLAFWLALFTSHLLLSIFPLESVSRAWPELWNWSVNPRLYIFAFLAIVAMFWFWTDLAHYSYSKPFLSETKEVWQTITALAVVDLALKAVLHLTLSHAWWVITWGLVIIAIPLVRYINKRVLLKFGYWRKPTIIIGNGSNARATYNALGANAIMGCEITGFVPTQNGNIDMREHPLISDSSVFEAIKRYKNVKFVFALEPNQEDILDHWIRTLVQHRVVDISVIPPIKGIPLYGTHPHHFFSHEILMLRVQNNMARRLSRIFKRLFDVVAATLISLLISPLLVYLYIQIKKSGGSVLFGHDRVGQNGNTFKCYKFRSMVPDAAERLAELLRTSPEARAEWEREFKLKNDPRITSIGHFLRKSSLDELPQLWNVIKGDMSLVGPRPVVKEELERYKENVIYYHMCKPGMTGLWQVSGRNDVDYETRVYLDVWYLKNWSLWYDLAILIKTFGVIFNRSGAY